MLNKVKKLLKSFDSNNQVSNQERVEVNDTKFSRVVRKGYCVVPNPFCPCCPCCPIL